MPGRRQSALTPQPTDPEPVDPVLLVPSTEPTKNATVPAF
jgi:hypothetical protein